MSCYTMSMVELNDDTYTKKAREKLGLPLEGKLSRTSARRVRQEAGFLKATDEVRRLQPNAVIRRRGDKLFVTVGV